MNHHNLEAERSVLSALLFDGKAIAEIADILEPRDFFREDHVHIYEAVLFLFKQGIPVDSIMLIDYLQSVKKLELAGGPTRISEIAQAAWSSASIKHYAKVVRDKAILRRTISALQLQLQLSKEAPENSEEFLRQTIECIGKAAAIGNQDSMSASDAAVKALQEIKDLNEGRYFAGIRTHLADLDACTRGGFRPGQMIILAGRPGSGKSALSLQWALSIGGTDKSVAFFSLEMSQEELNQRAISVLAGVSSSQFRAKGLTDYDMDKVTDAAKDFGSKQITFDCNPRLNAHSLLAKAQRLRMDHKCDMIMVDYLQLMMGERKRGDNREQEIAALSHEMKLLARRLEIPVMMLCQLNRGPEERTDGRPKLSDLRESGSIEQDADIVMSIYKPWIYSPTQFEENYSRLEVLKNRGGQAHQTIELEFEAMFTRFVPWAGRKGGKRDVV